MLQKIIKRMARNSFQIKAWAATIFIATIALTYSVINIIIFIVLIFVIVMFWGLDSYYLRQERLYRALYNEKVSEFNKNADKITHPYSMNVNHYKDDEASTFRIMFSVSELPYYIAFLITIIILLILNLSVIWLTLV